MDVAGAALQGGEDDGVNQANDGTDLRVPREPVHTDVFFAFFLANDLEGEALGGLLQHALGLLGALEQVADLPGGGHLDDQLTAQQKREFVGLQQAAGIGHGDYQQSVA